MTTVHPWDKLYTKEPKKSGNIHVGELWKPYPTFDSYDSSDNRHFYNFIVRDHPITEEEMQSLRLSSSGTNYTRISPYVSNDLLPIVYYNEGHDKIVVATM